MISLLLIMPISCLRQNITMILSLFVYINALLKMDKSLKERVKFIKFSLRSRIKLATDVILSFSDRPLKVGILIGILMSITAFVYSLRILFLYYFSSQNISAWASLMITVLLSSGIILIVLGIVGTYIGKIYNEVKKRPLFVVEKYLNLDEKF